MGPCRLRRASTGGKRRAVACALVAVTGVWDLSDRAKDLLVEAIVLLASIGRTENAIVATTYSAHLRELPRNGTRQGNHMGTFLGLFALSLILGFVLGRLSWAAIVISSAALAALVVAVLPWHGFEILPGIATLAACLATHQVAYLSFVGHARGSVSRPRPVRQAA